ncbi:SNF2 family N-terminal domain-containing protein [Bisporella sp. PMI_857]|nr:SNF2 family N-terminal domain-containing protein [Bisporella sp. PMI_857]
MDGPPERSDIDTFDPLGDFSGKESLTLGVVEIEQDTSQETILNVSFLTHTLKESSTMPAPVLSSEPHPETSYDLSAAVTKPPQVDVGRSPEDFGDESTVIEYNLDKVLQSNLISDETATRPIQVTTKMPKFLQDTAIHIMPNITQKSAPPFDMHVDDEPGEIINLANDEAEVKHDPLGPSFSNVYSNPILLDDENISVKHEDTAGTRNQKNTEFKRKPTEEELTVKLDATTPFRSRIPSIFRQSSGEQNEPSTKFELDTTERNIKQTNNTNQDANGDGGWPYFGIMPRQQQSAPEEMSERDLRLLLTTLRGKRPKRKGSSSLGNPKKSPKKSRKDRSSTSKPKQKKYKQNVAMGDDEEYVNFESLFGNESGPEFDAAPSIEASTKKVQLEAMLAGCPSDSHMPQNRRDRATIHRASKSFHNRMVRAVNGAWRLDGMRTALYHHQIMAAAWMHGRELNNDDGPRGGILADAMGLGKTLELIATCAANPPSFEQIMNHKGATLIVVPAVVLDQWEREIIKHRDSMSLMSIHVFRASENKPTEAVASNNIVLTSYSQVTKSLPWNNLAIEGIRKQNRKTGEDPADDDPQPIQKFIQSLFDVGLAGTLHLIKWHRVILDESHWIKNHLSRGSLAVDNLLATYRWAASGTPIMNRLEEYFAYHRFLKLPTGRSYPEFRDKFCNSDQGMKKLKEINEKFLLRRTTQSMLLGRPLLSLPKPTPHTIPVRSTAAATVIYGAFHMRFKGLKDTVQKGDPAAKFKNLLNQLTRLRQLTFDILAIPRETKMLFDDCHFEAILKDLLKVTNESNYIYKEFKKLRKEKVEEAKVAAIKRQLAGMGIQDDDCDEDYEQCGICCDTLVDAQVIKTKHCDAMFCNSCINEHIAEIISKGNSYLYCPACNAPFDDFEDVVPQSKKRKSKNSQAKYDWEKPSHYQRKGVDSCGHRFIPHTHKASAWEWIHKHDAKQGKVPRSPKLKATRDELYSHARGLPEDKKIIFVQFAQSAIAIGTMLQEDGYRFVYFDGTMSAQQRNKAVSLIEQDPEVKFMICGLKCGSLGLNWVWANHVLIIDPWWNECVELQAFSRTHRIGQEKQTHFIKLYLCGGVDDKLLQVQRKKNKMLAQSNARILTSQELEKILEWNPTTEDDDEV